MDFYTAWTAPKPGAIPIVPVILVVVEAVARLEVMVLAPVPMVIPLVKVGDRVVVQAVVVDAAVGISLGNGLLAFSRDLPKTFDFVYVVK